MSTIRQLPSGKWNVQVRLKGHPAKSSTHPTREAALSWAEAQEGEAKQRPQTLPHLIDHYLREVMVTQGSKRGGYEATKYRLRTLSSHFGDRPLSSISSERVAQYKVVRLSQVKSSTVRLELQLLSRVLRWAKGEKGIDCTDSVQEVKLPEAGRARDKVIGIMEFESVLTQLKPEMRSIAILAWETAMRRSEILSITPRMINARTKIVSLSLTKNGESRDVPLSVKALTLLLDLANSKGADVPIFNVRPHSVSKAFRRACDTVGLTGVCFHSLRHSCITRYAEKGLNTIQLQCISGHKDITMLARYSHINASSVAELMG